MNGASLTDLLQYLVVGLIVLVAAWSAARRHLPRGLRARLFGEAAPSAGGCDSGCGSCGTGCATPVDVEAAAGTGRDADGRGGDGQGSARRVIRLHSH